MLLFELSFYAMSASQGEKIQFSYLFIAVTMVMETKETKERQRQKMKTVIRNPYSESPGFDLLISVDLSQTGARSRGARGAIVSRGWICLCPPPPKFGQSLGI